MKKIIFRFLSFAVDYVVILIIASLVMLIPVFNKEYKDSTKTTKKYYEYQTEYENVVKKVEDTYSDGKLTVEESIDIYNTYSKSSKLTAAISEDKEVSEKDKEEFLSKLEEERIDISSKLAYKVNKSLRVSNIVTIVIAVLYLGVIQYILKGQTIGKKIFKLRVLSTNDKNVSLIKYIIRAILVTEALIIGADVCAMSLYGYKAYITFSNYLSMVKYIYEMAFLMAMFIRVDQKSIHDMLLNTRVALFDKDNNEVESIIFNEPVVNEEKESVKEVKKSTKVKTTTKKPAKKTKKEKEVVVAEKVND